MVLWIRLHVTGLSGVGMHAMNRQLTLAQAGADRCVEMEVCSFVVANIINYTLRSRLWLLVRHWERVGTLLICPKNAIATDNIPVSLAFGILLNVVVVMVLDQLFLAWFLWQCSGTVVGCLNIKSISILDALEGLIFGWSLF